MDGILLVDKGPGKTSHDVVAAERRRLGTPKVGHAGTLDPSATGLLVLGVGRALRLLEFLEVQDKEYEVEITFGTLTDTDDADGRPVGTAPVPDGAALEAALGRLRGAILQTPPAYAAIKVGGRKLYQYAREGKAAAAAPRAVRVDRLDLLSYEPPRGRFLVKGSKGLYVRALARDLGGHVTRLRRTASGVFRVEQAGPTLLPMETAVAHLPEVVLDAEEASRFRNGRELARTVDADRVRVSDGIRLIGIGRRSEGGLRPSKVLG
jgi:tRNA pseudouridine55 synthase